MKPFAVIIFLMLSLTSAAHADDPDLSKAYDICKEKMGAEFMDGATGKSIRRWQRGYENCEKIVKAYNFVVSTKTRDEIEFINRIAADIK